MRCDDVDVPYRGDLHRVRAVFNRLTRTTIYCTRKHGAKLKLVSTGDGRR